jgi:hypothetical protein
MKNKILKQTATAIFALLIALFFSSSKVLAAEATLVVNPNTSTVNRGCTFSIGIDLNTGGVQTDGTDAILKYDPTRFTATNIVNGSIYPDYPGNSIDNTGGKINVSGLASPDTPFSSSGTLATVNFTVLQTAPLGASQITFDFDPNNKAKTTDSNVVERGTIVDVLGSVTNGTFTVGTGTCTTVGPGASTSPTTPGGTTTTGATGTKFGTIPVGGKGGLEGTPSTITQLPQSAITGPTLILSIVGGALTVLGIIGLALF